MDQKSDQRNEVKDKLPELPKHDDEFWGKADNEILKIKDPITCDKALHNFIRVKGMEAQCVKCRTGYYLPVGAVVKEGHIYIKDEFVI